MPMTPDRGGDLIGRIGRIVGISRGQWPAARAAVSAFVRLGRPLFLLGGVVLNGLGAAIATATGVPFDGLAFIGGQVVISATQLMTHFSNEYFDIAADRANATPSAWSGGSRVLPAGELPPRVALGAAIGAAATAMASMVVVALTMRPAPGVATLLILSIVLAWGYSSPPLRLHSRGVGEVVGALLVAGCTPLVGYGLQARQLDWMPVLIVMPLCCLQFAMLVVVSLPDVQGDAMVGKRTLAVLLGGRTAARLAAAALLLSYALLPLLVALGLPVAAALGYVAWLPVAGWHARRLWRLRPGEAGLWDSLGFWSITLVMGSALTVGLVLALAA